MHAILIKMIPDIVQTIEQYCLLKNRLALININKNTYENICVTRLAILPKMDINIFHQKKYSKLKFLDCSNNTNIINLNHLKHSLEILYCGSNRNSKNNIDKNSIKDLRKLRILDCSGNHNMTSVNRFADTLEELYCVGSKISQFGISKLKKIIHFACSEYIEDVNHLANTLITLDCSCSAYITQKGISQLNKVKIFRCESRFVNDVSHLADTLEELSCPSIYCAIGQNNMFKLKHIKKLNCRNNMNISNVNFLSETLEELNCSGKHCALGQNGISKLNRLRVLDCHCNNNIRDLNHMADTLEDLNCSWSNSIDLKGISDLRCLKKIDCKGNRNICMGHSMFD